ncbi:sensor histidine kinase [Anaerosacchariphilus polymeriproducens]|uniref:histidine kinase n=1 Tax=Anaerosacchariphilus polymeriproducens TaxID=1812858 RepID=A0A371AVM6_9FIRM|nr:ATP-binding protein [Anaerosacchariphilus polymeriproducens]RDU23635.1 sensor histidine kinase [Anaerosacchariphilus polymeriproducens]
MIKKIVDVCRKNIFWFLMLLVLNVMFGTFLWLIDEEGFVKLFCVMLLGSFGLYCISIFVVYKTESKKEKAILEFLENPDLHREKKAVNLGKGTEKNQIYLIGRKLREKDEKIKESNFNIQEYEEYIESWAHEIKNPLALMTFVLDNRKEEISPIIYRRLEYIRNQMQENIDRILYYARLKSVHTDYLFEKISLQKCCYDILKEYEILLQEQKFSIINEVQDIQVLADEKGLIFILSQVISNSIKYVKPEDKNPFLHLFTIADKEKGYLVLGIRDNGIGVKPYDIPFLFDKGFTGDIGEQRKRATGMGLYLAKQVALALNVRIEIVEEYNEGFEIHFLFPIIE